jgi:toxin ParE1/3/4
MAGINWTAESEKCLTEIYDYIAEIRDREIRILLYGHYRIVYLLRDSQQNIDILGVFHGSMDIETRLDSD